MGLLVDCFVWLDDDGNDDGDDNDDDDGHD